MLPRIYSTSGQGLCLEGIYRDACAFLICGGPSLARHDLSQLTRRGMLTCAVNNAAVVHRPNLWISVDNPKRFCDAIWYDPGILKFVPIENLDRRFCVRAANGRLVRAKERLRDLPGLFGFERNHCFDAEKWLFQDTFNCGNSSSLVDATGYCGGRSVMLVAIKLLFYLGIRRLFLLGCDFQMQTNAPNYAFDQQRTDASIHHNNRQFLKLNARLNALKPHFERENYHIFNCTPNSGLKVFPYVAFDAAIDAVTSPIPRQINTSGMYDEAALEREHSYCRTRPALVIPVRGGGETSALGEPAHRFRRRSLLRLWKRYRGFGDARNLWVATDSREVESLVKSWGGNVLLTDRAMPSDLACVASVARQIEGNLILGLPLRGAALDQRLVGRMISTWDRRRSDVLLPIFPLRSWRQVHDAGIVKVVRSPGGQVLYLSRAPVPYVTAEVEGKEEPAGRYWGLIPLWAFSRRACATLELLAEPPGGHEEFSEFFSLLAGGFRLDTLAMGQPRSLHSNAPTTPVRQTAQEHQVCD